MNRIYERLQERNPSGILYKDAVQVFLWLFCEKVPQLPGQEATREDLVEGFCALSAKGLILDVPRELGREEPSSAAHWQSLLARFFKNEVQLDWDFRQRLPSFL